MIDVCKIDVVQACVTDMCELTTSRRLKVRKSDSSADMTSSVTDLSERDTQPRQRRGCCGT